MKFPKHFYTTSLLAACLCLSGPTFAYGGPGGDMGYRGDSSQERGWSKGKRAHGGPMGQIKKVLRNLDLSDEQRDQVYAIMDEARPKMRDLMDDMRKQRRSFREISMEEDFDSKKIEASAEAQSELMKRMMLEGAQLRSDIFKILTTEQREQVKKQMERRKRPF